MQTPPGSVIESNGYLAKAAKIFSDAERAEIVDMLARDPLCGDVISHGGGIRKVRFARPVAARARVRG